VYKLCRILHHLYESLYGIYTRKTNRIFFVSVMLAELEVFVIKLHVPNNPVKILSSPNYSALVARSESFSLLFLHHPLPSTRKRTYTHTPCWFLNHRSGNWRRDMTRNVRHNYNDVSPLYECSNWLRISTM
jgi:hypothetical protein